MDSSTIQTELQNKKLIRGTFGKILFSREYIELTFENMKQLRISPSPTSVQLYISFQFNDFKERFSNVQFQPLLDLLSYSNVDDIGWTGAGRPEIAFLKLSIEKSMVERNYQSSTVSAKGGFAYFPFLKLADLNRVDLVIALNRTNLPLYKMASGYSAFLDITYR